MILVLRDISFQGRCVNSMLSPRCVPLGESLGWELRCDHNNLETVSGLGCCCTQWPPLRAWPWWHTCFRPLSDEPSVSCVQSTSGAVGTNSIQRSSWASCQTNVRYEVWERGEPSLYPELTAHRSWGSGWSCTWRPRFSWREMKTESPCNCLMQPADNSVSCQGWRPDLLPRGAFVAQNYCQSEQNVSFRGL